MSCIGAGSSLLVGQDPGNPWKETRDYVDSYYSIGEKWDNYLFPDKNNSTAADGDGNSQTGADVGELVYPAELGITITRNEGGWISDKKTFESFMKYMSEHQSVEICALEFANGCYFIPPSNTNTIIYSDIHRNLFTKDEMETVVAQHHTHPVGTEAFPSEQDAKFARSNKIPVYTYAANGERWFFDPKIHPFRPNGEKYPSFDVRSKSYGEPYIEF